MSHVARADWAAQVPASGIQGVIPAVNLPDTSTSGPTDIGGLKGAGYAPGQVPVWNGHKFVPGNLPTTPTSTAAVVPSLPYITWAGVSLRPLESTEVSFPLPGVTMNSQIFVASPVGQDYVFYQGEVLTAPTIRVLATNMSGDIVALVDGTYKVWVLD